MNLCRNISKYFHFVVERGKNMKFINKFRIGYWNVGVIEKSIESIMAGEEYEIRWMKHYYKDRFFADSFLHHQDEKYYYILAEELIFIKKKGTIVLLKIDKKTMKLIQRTEMIADDYHLSYPNLENGAVIAENYKSGCLSRFTFEGETVKKTKILDIPLIDPTFVNYQGRKWLFGTTKDQEMDSNCKLSIFVEKDGEYIPHVNNPVKVNVNSARPGGKFFWYKGELYRPAQNCEHLYGEDIQIMRITQLDEEGFSEEYVKTVSSHSSSKFNLGLHTFNVYDNCVVVDGFEYSIQFLQKVINKLAGC